MLTNIHNPSYIPCIFKQKDVLLRHNPKKKTRMKIAIIGAGNMGSAIARGLAKGNLVQPEDITVSNPSTGKLDALQAEIPGLNVTTSNVKAMGEADIVFLAVKPRVLDKVLGELPLRNGLIVASVVAGRGINSILDYLSMICPQGNVPDTIFFRIVPNTAAAIGQSMTLVSSLAANPKQRQLMLELLAPLGPAMWVPEEQLSAATALASCGTAYVMKYIQAATQAGIELGLKPQDARRMVTQCVLGAAALLQDNPDAHPATEIEKVCTPGGYTIRGINELEHGGFTSAIIKAIKASV